MSSLGAIAITDSIQGPPAPANILGNEINRAKMGDAVGNLSSGQGMLILFSDIRDSLLKIAENTLRTNELLKGTDAEQRDKNIGDSDTDGDEDKSKDRGPSALDKLKGIFSKLNPFSDGGPGPIGTAVIAGLGLLGLSLFGDEAQKGIEYLLNAIKNGKIGEMLSNLGDSIKEQFIRLKKIIVSIITGITDYINQFDTDGIDGLSPKEFDAMIESVTTKISEGIFGFAASLAGSILQAFTIYTVGSTALKLLAGNGIKAAVAGGALSLGGALTIAGAVAALGAVIVLGALKLQDNIATAYEDATTDALGQPQDFAPKEFITRLLVGKKTGNKIKDVLQNAYDKMFIGAATGAAIGGVAGAGVFSIPAAGFGAVIGALSGITIGALTAYYGDEAVDKVIKDMTGEESPLGMMASYITDQYKKLILTPFEFIFGKLGTEGDSLFSKMQKKLGNPSGSNERKIYSKEDLYGENVNSDNLANKSTTELLSILNKNKSAADALQPTRGKLLGFDFLDGYGKLDKMLTGDQQHDLKGHKLIIEQTEKELIGRGINLNGAPDFLQTGKLGNDNIKVMPIVNTLEEEVKKRELGREMDTIIANNNNVIDNSTKVVTNAPGGNDFNPYPSDVERMLNRLNGMGVA